MTISVACKCGQKFGVKDEMAGKRVKCPGCAAVVQIPGGAAPKINLACGCGKKLTVSAQLAGKRVKCPGCGNAVTIPPASSPTGAPTRATSAELDAIGNGIGELLNEVGFDKALTEHSCPNCKSHMGPGAIICIECGYNLETGKQIATKVIQKQTPGPTPPANAKKGKKGKKSAEQNIAKALIWPGVWLVLAVVVFIALGQIDPKSLQATLPEPLFGMFQSFGQIGAAALCLVIGLIWGLYDFSRLQKS